MMTAPTHHDAPPEETLSSVQRLLAEGPLGMSAAARRLGTFRDSKTTHPSTVVRWARDGITLPDGRKLKLESITLNGRLATSWPAVVRFIQAQQQPQTAAPAGGPVRSPSVRQRASERAASELEKMGC